MQRPAIGHCVGLLPVRQEWFADMAEYDFFEVVEWLDRRVLTGATACPFTK
jgi:hypothetical protein